MRANGKQPLEGSLGDRLQVGTDQAWTIEDSERLYRVKEWGEPYFSINPGGRIAVSPQGRSGSLDLFELVEALRRRNIGLPLLIRFSDILADRLEQLNGCFARAIARYSYPGTYRGVFPIKCNQHRHLVEALVRYGKPYQFGLEAGSKPELTIALAVLEPSLVSANDEEPLLICNGYKDREYIETALLATKLGQKLIIVIEQLEELHLVIEISRLLGIKPTLGVRAKLSTKGTGRWGNSTGERSKFGLTISQILEVVQELQAAGMLASLELLHFHIGSQISTISVIKEAIREAAQLYGELVALGASMQYLNVGGGLAVDYDGSKTNCSASKNYSMQNYANDIVAEVKEACEEKTIAAPVLISESGRAIASHQSVLVFEVLSTDDVSHQPPPPVLEKEHLIIRNLWDTYSAVQEDNYQEAYHDAIQFKEEAISLFSFGYLSLQERARAEQLYWACCGKILELIRQQEYVPDDLEDLEKNMASIYHINLSVFQSVPDAWAIDQLFPIVPIHRLDEEPTQRGILADLTCDSDGKIDQFIDLRGVKTVLELHPLCSKDGEQGEQRGFNNSQPSTQNQSSVISHQSSVNLQPSTCQPATQDQSSVNLQPSTCQPSTQNQSSVNLQPSTYQPSTQNQSSVNLQPSTYQPSTRSHTPYYLGMFLVGAYQEVMGNLHNLFGDTNVVHVQMNPKGYQIESVVKGDTVTEVLGYVQYSAEELIETIRRRTEHALQENRISLEESQKLLQNYERSLSSYTYLT